MQLSLCVGNKVSGQNHLRTTLVILGCNAFPMRFIGKTELKRRRSEALPTSSIIYFIELRLGLTMENWWKNSGFKSCGQLCNPVTFFQGYDEPNYIIKQHYTRAPNKRTGHFNLNCYKAGPL